jgi:hypothetical protein
VAPNCPVPQEGKAPTVARAPTPNGWVTWRRTGQRTVPVRSHRTVRCDHRQQPPQRLPKWLEAINTLQPPQLQASMFSEDHIQYKSSSIHSKTQYKRSNPLQVPNSFQTLSGLRERERILCSFEFLSLGLSFFFSNSYSQVLCKRGKRHQVCGGPCGVLVTREIKEEGSLGLSDRLR